MKLKTRSLELKIPPALLVMLAAACMWAATMIAPGFRFDLPAKALLATALAATGSLICFLGISSFRRAGTTVNPLRPESSASLVTSGIYSVTRNPMYLGFLLLLAGLAIFLANLLALAILPIFVLYLSRFQIRPEEMALESLFGERFADYKRKVRRWI